MKAASRQWRATAVLLTCFLTVFSAYSIRYSYGTLLPEMLSPLSITKAEAGVIYAAYFIAYTIISPIVGIMADRCNARTLLTVFVVIMGIGTYLMQYATSLAQASVYFTIAGIGCAACWAPVMAVAQRWIRPERRGLYLSLVDAGGTLGVMTAGALIPFIVARWGWQKGWAMLGILALVAGIANFVYIRNQPEATETTTVKQDISHARPAVSYRGLFNDSRFWLIGLAYLLTGFSIIIPFTFLSTFAVQELHLSYESSTMLITVIGVGGIIGKLTLGPLSDKLGRISIMIACAAFVAGGTLGMAFCDGIILHIASCAFGVGYGACWALYAACASDYFSRDSAGGIIGLWTIYLGIGSIIAPIVSGWAADMSGTLRWAFIMAAAGGIGSFALLVPLRKRREVAGGKAPVSDGEQVMGA